MRRPTPPRRVYDLSAYKAFTLIARKSRVAGVRGPFGSRFVYPVVVICSFIFRGVQVLVYALVGLLHPVAECEAKLINPDAAGRSDPHSGFTVGSFFWNLFRCAYHCFGCWACVSPWVICSWLSNGTPNRPAGFQDQSAGSALRSRATRQ